MEVQKRFRDWAPWKCGKGSKLRDRQQTIALETRKHQLYDVLWKVRDAKTQLCDVFSKARENTIQFYNMLLEAGDATPPFYSVFLKVGEAKSLFYVMFSMAGKAKMQFYNGFLRKTTAGRPFEDTTASWHRIGTGFIRPGSGLYQD